VLDVTDLRNRVAMSSPGAKIELILVRNEKQEKLTVQVEEQPADMTRSGSPQDQQLFQKMGMSLQDLTPELASHPAARGRIQAGSLIEEVNRQPVPSLKELQQIMQKTGDTQDVLLLIRSGNRSFYVVLGVK